MSTVRCTLQETVDAKKTNRAIESEIVPDSNSELVGSLGSRQSWSQRYYTAPLRRKVKRPSPSTHALVPIPVIQVVLRIACREHSRNATTEEFLEKKEGSREIDLL